MSTEDKGIVINSTASQIEQFINSWVWKDMLGELEVWREMVSSEYTDVSDLLNLGKIQGRIEALNYFLELPRVLRETVKERQKEKQDDARRNKAE